MNKVLLAVGLLSAGVAFGQNQTASPSSTTTSTSNYNTSNTNNENSRNATMGTNSSTNRPASTTSSSYRSGSATTGTRSNTGTSSMSNGSDTNSSTMGSSSRYNGNSSGSGTGTSTTGNGSYNNTGSSTSGSYNSAGTSATTPSTNDSNSMGTSGTSATTPSNSGSYNTNSVGTGTSATTPSTTDYNSNANTGTSVTTNNTYSTETTTAQPARTKDYKNFAYGIYAGLNTTRFRGESIDTDNPSGRLGYQAGFFVRGGGRLYGQIGAEYFASSSNYFRAGDGQTPTAIRDQIDIQYIQIPVYIGYKLTESDRGISAIRVQVGAEYANRINSSSGRFNLSTSEIKSGSFNALGQLGFDIGPFLIDLTYHHGLSDAVQINTFQGSSRRILSASVGFKF